MGAISGFGQFVTRAECHASSAREWFGNDTGSAPPRRCGRKLKEEQAPAPRRPTPGQSQVHGKSCYRPIRMVWNPRLRAERARKREELLVATEETLAGIAAAHGRGKPGAARQAGHGDAVPLYAAIRRICHLADIIVIPARTCSLPRKAGQAWQQASLRCEYSSSLADRCRNHQSGDPMAPTGTSNGRESSFQQYSVP